MRRAKRPRPAELDEAARRRREQIARALTPREQLTLAAPGKQPPPWFVAAAEHAEAVRQESAKNAYYDRVHWRARPPGIPSNNQLERKRGNMAVLSLRIDATTLAKLDEEVNARAGDHRPMAGPSGWREKYQVNFRPVCRSSLILEAVDAWLNALANARRAA